MPIRRRFSKPKKLLYHRLYGSVEMPPISDMGCWPNGSPIMSQRVPGYRGQQVIIGWAAQQTGLKQFGLWLCTELAVGAAIVQNAKGKKSIPVVDPFKFDKFKYIASVPESTPYYQMQERIIDEFGEHHDILM